MSRILKQPLLWFFIIGCLLFAADSLFGVKRDAIYVSTDLQDRLGLLWQTQTGKAVAPAELDSLVKNWIEEEVLYREALRLGLDQEDSIIRRRLVQKLSFIAESELTAEAETAEVEKFYSSRRENYTLPIRYSFRQLYFARQYDADEALAKITAGQEVIGLGETSMLSADYAYRSELDLNATFGAGFAAQLQAIEINTWQGPIKSGLGFHLVFLTAVHPPEVTPLAAITSQVLSDYGEFQKETARQLYLDNLLQQYEIIVEQR